MLSYRSTCVLSLSFCISFCLPFPSLSWVTRKYVALPIHLTPHKDCLLANAKCIIIVGFSYRFRAIVNGRSRRLFLPSLIFLILHIWSATTCNAEVYSYSYSGYCYIRLWIDMYNVAQHKVEYKLADFPTSACWLRLWILAVFAVKIKF